MFTGIIMFIAGICFHEAYPVPGKFVATKVRSGIAYVKAEIAKYKSAQK